MYRSDPLLGKMQMSNSAMEEKCKNDTHPQITELN